MNQYRHPVRDESGYNYDAEDLLLKFHHKKVTYFGVHETLCVGFSFSHILGRLDFKMRQHRSVQ